MRTGDAVPGPAVSVLGVDDWAWRKGQRYGTILVDLERRRVVDLLPDRSADTLAAWLKDASRRVRRGPRPRRRLCRGSRPGRPGRHPGGGPMAFAAQQQRRPAHGPRSAPPRSARRGADRRPTTVVSDEPAVPEPGVPPEAERPMRAAERRSRAAQDRRDARFAEVARLRGQGLSLKAIARTLGMGRKTVRRWLRAGQAPTWRHADRGTSILDPYQAYLEERWQAGCHNAAALWRDLKAQGFPGQPGIVRAWATRRRRQDPPAAPANMAGQPAASKAAEPPTPRRAVRLLTGQPDTLDDADRRFVAALLERSPAIATAVDLVSRFVTMVKDQVADALDGWLREAEVSALAPFAAGLRRDEDAVRAALTEPWSNGQVEGQVNRLKVIKREMYGRAGFDLLRCRVLGHA